MRIIIDILSIIIADEIPEFSSTKLVFNILIICLPQRKLKVSKTTKTTTIMIFEDRGHS